MIRVLTLISFTLLAYGCTRTVPPVFEEPVPYSSLSAGSALGQRLTVGANGQVLLSWMERQDEGALLRVSALNDNRWLPPIDVVNDSKMFVNWADFPAVTALKDGHWLAHWLSYSANKTYSYDVRVAQTLDAGASWSSEITPHRDGTPTEHGFVSLWPAGSAAGLLWLDGRKTVNEVKDDPTSSGMTLRSALIDEQGKLSGEQEIDELICDCCQTDVAVSSKGPIAVYRDRSVDEIRDISIARFSDGKWQPPEAFSKDGWEIPGCPVNGPAIAANGDEVAVAWFTAARESPMVKVRVSSDGGQTFGSPIQVDTGDVLGHVDIAYIGDSSFAVSWMKRGDTLQDILLRSVTTQGDTSLFKTAGRTAVAHNVPQMIEHDGKLIMAWTDRADDGARIVAVSLDIVHAE